MNITDKSLGESKKAKQAWIGSLITIAAGFAGDYLKVDPQTLVVVIGSILGLFGVSIGAQGMQDKAKAAATSEIKVAEILDEDEDDFDLPEN